MGKIVILGYGGTITTKFDPISGTKEQEYRIDVYQEGIYWKSLYFRASNDRDKKMMVKNIAAGVDDIDGELTFIVKEI